MERQILRFLDESEKIKKARKAASKSTISFTQWREHITAQLRIEIFDQVLGVAKVLNATTRTLFSVVLVLLIHVSHDTATQRTAASLDVTPKRVKLNQILGMRASFICSSAFVPRLVSRKKLIRPRIPSRKASRRSTTRASAGSAGRAVVSNRNQKPRGQPLIACVGDIHGQWDDLDESALSKLNPDLALFVGDYGDEDVNVTQRIAAFAEKVDFGVATVFGNHDAFFTASPTGRQRAPYNKAEICRVTEQMEMLAPYDVSYRSTPFDNIGISICGGRSFTVGGPNWKYTDFFRKFIGVFSLDHSTSRMIDAVGSSKHENLVFLSHNGPVGLGDKPSDPCGKDWGKFPGGDYGDQDLREAIEKAREKGYKVPLTVFGHMHKTLMHGQGIRTMLKTEPDGETGHETVMLNAAVCPRHKIGSKSDAGLRNFQLVRMGLSGYVDEVQEAWISATGEILENTLLFRADSEEEEVGMAKENQEKVEAIDLKASNLEGSFPAT